MHLPLNTKGFVSGPHVDNLHLSSFHPQLPTRRVCRSSPAVMTLPGSDAAISLPTKPTLYHTQWWSSSRPYAVLLELGVSPDEVDVVTITTPQLKTDPVLVKINPQRRLPLFHDPTDNLTLTESGGLVQYLLEKYDTEGKLSPKLGDPTRPYFLQLLHFGPATSYHVGVPILFKAMPPEGVPATPADVCEQKKKEWHEIVAPTIEQALDKFGGPFLLGATFTAADSVVGYDVMTIAFTGVPELLENHPKVQAYLNVISQRDIYKKLYSPPTSN